jgi:hypothetical protein
MNVAIVTCEQALQQLLSDEAGRAGEQYIPHPLVVPDEASG